MKNIHRWIRNYFNFTQRETNGFILLILFLTLTVLIPFIWTTKPEPYNPVADQRILDSLAAQLKTQPYNSFPPRKSKTPLKPVPANLLRPFNPNNLTQTQWEELGLPTYVAQRIIKYRDKAKGFTYKEQLSRIYGFPPDLFAQLEPFILLPDKRTKPTFPSSGNSRDLAYTPYPKANNRPLPFKRKTFRLQPFDINTADTVQLKQIRGIGSKLAARILKFRNKLGGFGNMQQLQEVYGLSPEVVDSLRKYTFVSDAFVASKININTATLDELRQHPYLGFQLARHIIAYRTQHGTFRNLDDLLQIKTLDEATYRKIKPYLTL